MEKSRNMKPHATYHEPPAESCPYCTAELHHLRKKVEILKKVTTAELEAKVERLQAILDKVRAHGRPARFIVERIEREVDGR